MNAASCIHFFVYEIFKTSINCVNISFSCTVLVWCKQKPFIMRKILPAATLLLLISSASQAQKLVLLPQVGVQQFKLYYGNYSNAYYSNFYSNSPSVGARLSYISKKGHGPYVGFNVGDLSASHYINNESYFRSVTLYRFAAGYQWTPKPIYFKQLWNNGLSKTDFDNLAKKGLSLQLMPSLGFTYSRIAVGGLSTFNTSTTTKFSDSKGPANIGINAGMGLMFNKNGKQLFSITVDYTKGFRGIYGSSVITTPGQGSFLSTKGSGTNVSFGIPINIWKKKK